MKRVKDVAPAGDAGRSRPSPRPSSRPTISRRCRGATASPWRGGPLGTLALWPCWPLDCRGDLFHDFSTDDPACIALLTIAIVAPIVTAIHVPMLLLLRSGNYPRGLADFMAKTVLYGDPRRGPDRGLVLTLASG